MAAEIEGYVAGRHGGPKIYIEADLSVSASMDAKAQKSYSTDKRPTLPGIFGEFRVGEYLPYDYFHGTVRDPIVANAELINSTYISTSGSVSIEGGALATAKKGAVEIKAKNPIRGSSTSTSSKGILQADANSTVGGSVNRRQAKTSMAAFGHVRWPIGRFGFQNTIGPTPDPVRKSAAANQIELELKTLFCDLFDKHLSDSTFDASVSGAAHLGSIDLVRRSVNADGLVLMQGDRSQPATRYLYRAWKAENGQGRGLHFIRTYLQTLFPNACEVNQLWQDKSQPYPTSLYTSKPNFTWWLNYLNEPGLKLDGSWGLGQHRGGTIEDYKPKPPSMEGMYLTSRIEISLDFSVGVRSTSDLIKIIRSVLPARLLPVFRFNLREAFRADMRFYGSFSLLKKVDFNYPWDGIFLTEDPAREWQLGRDGEPVRLPANFGEFNVGELRGAKDGPKLRSRRFTGKLSTEKSSSMNFFRAETLAPDPEIKTIIEDPVKLRSTARKLDGTWPLGAHNRLDGFKLDGSKSLSVRKMAEYPRLGHFKLHNGKPKPIEPEKSRLTLSGRWKLGGPKQMAFSMTIEKVGAENAGV